MLIRDGQGSGFTSGGLLLSAREWRVVKAGDKFNKARVVVATSMNEAVEMAKKGEGRLFTPEEVKEWESK